MAALVAARAARPRVGVALSPDALCAAVRREGHSRLEAWRVSLAPLNGDGSSWPGLADALRMLARELGTSDGRLTVALMPPLAEARSVDLPELSDDELQQLLARGAGKYFATARGQQVVGAIRAGGRTKGATVPLVAVSAGRAPRQRSSGSCDGCWMELESIIPAEAAWSAAAAQSSGRGTSQLLVAHADRTDLLTVHDGRLAGIRRFRTGTEDARLIADAFPAGARHLGMVGNAEARREVARVLAARGLAAEALPGVAPELADSPDFLAAAFAAPRVAPMLVTDSMRATQNARVRSVTLRLAIAAGLLIVASLGFEWWGLRRELDSVKAQRAALASQISSTLVGRTTVENAFRQLAALGIEARATPHWSGIVAGLSQRLPAEAHLTGFRGRGDSVSVDGLAEHAARVFDALDKVPGITGVRSAGPVRLETPDDGPPMERFAIAAQVVRPATAKPVPKPPAARGAK